MLKSHISPATKSTLVEASPFTCAEFFAGIGLMRLGLEREGWSVVFANDNDPVKLDIYQGHFKDAEEHFLLDDIHNITADRVPTVTLATASFPCNDLSLAGARDGLAGAQSSAFWGFIRILEEMGSRRPPLALLENVTGFLTSNSGADFREALLALNDLGYDVDAYILDAAKFVPQSRQRLFVRGVQNGNAAGEFLTAEDVKHPARPEALASFILSHPNIRWALQSLPALPDDGPQLETILEDIPHDAPEWWGPERATYLLNQMSDRHRETADRMIAARKWSYGTVFRRMRNDRSMAELRTDGIAGCLRTPRGGSGRQILFKAGYGKYYARLITPREAARLMGADDFQLTGVSLNKALFGFGDAVCVPVVEWVAKHALAPAAQAINRQNYPARSAAS
jgi:DNA (cytosine-5)-methyltransferase 1